MRVDDLFKFMEARHAVYLARTAGVAKPWTSDVILQNYRFCNVYRELDKETIWLRENWRADFDTHEDVWFAMLIARTVNWSPTLAELGGQYGEDALPWSRLNFLHVLEQRRQRKEKIWTGAYMVTTHKKPVPKPIYYADMLDQAWKRRAVLRPKSGDTLSRFHLRLMDVDGVGSFIAGQVIADTKQIRSGPLFKAADWHTWSAPGTGSIRGMNRVLQRPRKLGIDSLMWKDTMGLLMTGVRARMERSRALTQMVDAQDLQNCLCEFDKYERVRLGQGVPRSVYNGRGE